MTWKEYQKKPSRDFVGKQVRLLRALQSSVQNIAAGEILTITEKKGGFTLKGPRCKHCRVSVFFRKVDPSAVELI
jgi:hypothetical protein